LSNYYLLIRFKNYSQEADSEKYPSTDVLVLMSLTIRHVITHYHILQVSNDDDTLVRLFF